MPMTNEILKHTIVDMREFNKHDKKLRERYNKHRTAELLLGLKEKCLFHVRTEWGNVENIQNTVCQWW